MARAGDVVDDLRAVANRSLAGIHLPLVRYQPRGRVAVREGVTLVAFDLRPWGLNTAVVLGPVPPPERVFALADEFFAGCERPYNVRVEAGAEHSVEQELRARGWRVQQEMPVMVLPRIPAPPPPPAGLVIRPVTDEAGLSDYLAKKDPASPPSEWDGIDAALNPSVAVALDPEIALFVGYVDGKPVATAALYRVGDIAEIGAVATAPAYRRRGIGAALTWAAVAEGAARGCASAALTSSAMGYPVYLRMGFVHVYTYRSYTAPGL